MKRNKTVSFTDSEVRAVSVALAENLSKEDKWPNLKQRCNMATAYKKVVKAILKKEAANE